MQDMSTIEHGPIPTVDEANEDLETFANFNAKGEGIEVVRPSNTVHYYDYCPRDIVFVHGENAIATPC